MKPALATLGTDYQVSATTSTFVPLTGGTVLIDGTAGGVGTFNDAAVGGPTNIGFTFKIGCNTYTSFGVNVHGMLTLGHSTTNSNANNFAAAPVYPVIAPFWDQQHMYNAGGPAAGCTINPPIHVAYAVLGTAPNRVLTVDWHTQNRDAAGNYWWAGCGAPMNTYQLRLYEGTNVIEFHYGSMWTSAGQPTAATIGIAASSSDFISISPSGGTGFVASTATSNNNVALHLTPLSAGAIFRFTPCQLALTGRTAGANDGGTVNMMNDDSLFAGRTVTYSTTQTFTPFSMAMGGATCPLRNYTMTITGPAASDYRFQTTGTQTQAGSITTGATLTPGIIFQPSMAGLRLATLTILDNTSGCEVGHFFLAARGSSRIRLIGNVPQGGTSTMRPGDTLLHLKYVVVGTSQNFTPFTAENIATDPLLSAADVTYTINGSSIYTINPGSASIPSGGTNVPTITFSPGVNDIGPQSATLDVSAEGETRTYRLLAIGAAPQAYFWHNFNRIDSNTNLFVNQNGCVAEQVMNYEIEVENIGGVPFPIDGFEVYETDTVYGQGVPRYPFLRDGAGRKIPSEEYFLTTEPLVLPLSANQMPTYPIVLPLGFSKLYLSFVSHRPGKRFARLYLRTPGRNFFGYDTNGMLVNGLLTLDLFGRGHGSRLSDNAEGTPPKALTFGETYLGTHDTTRLTLMNPGTCTLRVDRDELLIDRGDVEEFEIIGMPDNLIDPVTNDLLIPPGEKDEIVLRFTPQQLGSRRAGMRLVTNDSTIQIPGVTERGTYYIDLYGTGRADLYAEGADFGQALIGGTGSERRHGVVRMENTKTIPVIIGSIEIEGDNAADFIKDSPAWPNLPYILDAGKEVELGILFAPANLPTGDRNAIVKFISLDGDTVIAPLHGIAGTRAIQVSPTAVNFGALTVGKRTRQTITITNTGTMTLRLEQPVLSPGSDFTIGRLDRLNLAPGQVEYLELTYTPSVAGASNATLTFENNGTTGAGQVNLSGTGLKTKFVDADPGSTAIGGNGGSDPLGTNSRGGTEGLNVSGVDGVSEVEGLALYQSIPNPAREIVEIRYRLAKSDEVELALYDAQGRLVRILESGDREMGENAVRVSVSDLPNGVYHYRLSSGGRSLSRVLRIVR